MKVNSSYDNSDAFLKLSFKQSLSYLNRLISSKALSSFFKTIENSSAASPALKERAKNLAHFHQHKKMRTIEGKKVFGKHLIHYGMNMERAKTLGKAPSKDSLKSTTTRARKAAKVISLEKRLKATEKKDGPVCFAASMNCIQQYFKLKESGLLSPKAFYKATGLHENGVPEEVVLARSLSSQVKPTNNSRNSKDYYKVKLKAKDKLFSSFFEFKFGHHVSGRKSEFKKHFLKDAPPGTYLMNLMDDRWKKGHSMVIVKNEDNSLFIYDPNFGSAIIPKQDAERTLKRVLNHPYYKGLDTLVYSRAHPKA